MYNDVSHSEFKSEMVKHPYLPKLLKSDEMSKFESYITQDFNLHRPDLTLYENHSNLFKYQYGQLLFLSFKRFIMEEIQHVNELISHPHLARNYTFELNEQLIQFSTGKSNFGKSKLCHDYKDTTAVINWTNRILDRIKRWEVQYPHLQRDVTKEELKVREEELTNRMVSAMGW